MHARSSPCSDLDASLALWIRKRQVAVAEPGEEKHEVEQNDRTERRLSQTRDAVDTAEQVLARLQRGRDLQAVTVLDILEARTALWSAREAEIAAEADRLETRLQLGIRLECVLVPDG